MAQTLNNTAFRKYMHIICLVATVIVPILNNFVLSLIVSLIDGDIMLTVLSSILSHIISALGTLDLFLVYAVLINDLMRFGLKKSRRTVLLCFLRLFIIYASYITIGAIITSNFTRVLVDNLYYCGINALIDTLLLIGAIVLTCFLRAKYVDENNTDITVRSLIDTRNPLLTVTFWTVILITAFMLSGCVINTVMDISRYGANNLNATEVIYLVSPYVELVIKAFLGYFLMALSAKWFDIQWKHSFKKLIYGKKYE